MRHIYTRNRNPFCRLCVVVGGSRLQQKLEDATTAAVTGDAMESGQTDIMESEEADIVESRLADTLESGSALEAPEPSTVAPLSLSQGEGTETNAALVHKVSAVRPAASVANKVASGKRGGR